MIDWHQLKDKYEQFRHWQRQPVKFVNSDEEHCCNCCGTTYTGNFCPCCAQKSTIGHISWKSVHQGVMDIWGLGTRSLLFSIWHLLLRPGYFISDYINGKRQVSFPPVKMLFIVTVIYSLVAYWFFPQVLGISFNEIGDEGRKLMGEYVKWYESHFSWAMLLMSILAIIPTWVMFRYAPRNTRHTLPEGFFIQILLSVIIVVLDFFLIPINLISPQARSIIASLITMLYYIIAYKQLFGYGLWGTFWREAIIMTINVLCVYALVMGVFFIDFGSVTTEKIGPDRIRLMKILSGMLLLLSALIVLATGYVINLIATRKARKNEKIMLTSKRDSNIVI